MLTTALLLFLFAPEPPPLSPRLDAFAQTCQRQRGIAADAFRRHLRAQARGRTGYMIVLAGPDADERLERAAVVAHGATAELHTVILGTLVGKQHEQTEANLDAVLAEAEKSGAVLFFDEADALFGKRTDVKDAHDRYANQEVSYVRARLLAHPDLVVVGVRAAPEGEAERPPQRQFDALLRIEQTNPPEPVRPWQRLCWPAR